MRQPNDHVDRFYEARDAFRFAFLPPSEISALGAILRTGIRARGSILGCLEGGGGGGGGGEVSCPNQPTTPSHSLTFTFPASCFPPF